MTKRNTTGGTAGVSPVINAKYWRGLNPKGNREIYFLRQDVITIYLRWKLAEADTMSTGCVAIATSVLVADLVGYDSRHSIASFVADIGPVCRGLFGPR